RTARRAGRQGAEFSLGPGECAETHLTKDAAVVHHLHLTREGTWQHINHPPTTNWVFYSRRPPASFIAPRIPPPFSTGSPGPAPCLRPKCPARSPPVPAPWSSFSEPWGWKSTTTPPSPTTASAPAPCQGPGAMTPAAAAPAASTSSVVPRWKRSEERRA